MQRLWCDAPFRVACTQQQASTLVDATCSRFMRANARYPQIAPRRTFSDLGTKVDVDVVWHCVSYSPAFASTQCSRPREVADELEDRCDIDDWCSARHGVCIAASGACVAESSGAGCDHPHGNNDSAYTTCKRRSETTGEACGHKRRGHAREKTAIILDAGFIREAVPQSGATLPLSR